MRKGRGHLRTKIGSNRWTHNILDKESDSTTVKKKLTEKARVAFSFDNLKISSLIYIGQLCDDDCIAIFTKYDVQIIRHNEIQIRGKQTDNGLWKVPLSKNQPTLASNLPETASQKKWQMELLKLILQN